MATRRPKIASEQRGVTPRAATAPPASKSVARPSEESALPAAFAMLPPPPGLLAPPGLEVPASSRRERRRGDRSYRDAVTGSRAREVSEDRDSFDEEFELLRCEAELVTAAVEIGTTSADDDFLTDEDEDDSTPAMASRPPRQRLSVASVVIEEDEEDMFSGAEVSPLSCDTSEMRGRLWAQSLLRLKRSIDEIHLLCEFESDYELCEQVRAILELAFKDFDALLRQLDSQQEYALLPGDYPFKSGIAWTTRTPRLGRQGEALLEQLEKVHKDSPGHRGSAQKLSQPSSTRSIARSRSACEDAEHETGGTGEALLPTEEQRLSCERQRQGREEQFERLVRSALDRVHSRLGQVLRPSAQELRQRHEDRQRRAQELRASQDDLRLSQVRMTESRITAARERRQEREERRQRELLEKMARARRQYQDQLRNVCQRARNENRKTAEVVFIRKEALKSEGELQRQKQEIAQLQRSAMRDQMRTKLIDSATRVAKVSENRRRQLEAWQLKLQQELAEKERLASQRRREHMESIRMKSAGQESRSEMVQRKHKELQEVHERSSQDFLRFRSQNIGRMAFNCDDLPDRIREEAEMKPEGHAASRRTSPREAFSKRQSRGLQGGLQLGRPSTPPPGSKGVASPASSPGGFASVAVTSLLGDEAPTPVTSPKLPSVPLMPGAGHSRAEEEQPEAAEAQQAAEAAVSTELVLVELEATKADTAEPRQTLPATSAVEVRTARPGATLSDEDALRLICEAEPRAMSAQTANAAHRTRISKLAADLAKAAGYSLASGSSSASTEDLCAAQHSSGTSLNLEKIDAVLADFSKVLLGQEPKREADIALVLKLGCGRIVVDICARIKDSMALLPAVPAGGEQKMPAGWRQISNTMLGALKWLALLSKQRAARVHMILTNRMVALVDVAIACLDMHFAASGTMPEHQSMSMVFLPQLLLVLSTHAKQAVPESHGGSHQQDLVSFLLLCGLAERLRELFLRSEIRGLRAFEGASPLPLLLLRAMGFLGTLMAAYRPEPSKGSASTAPVLEMLRQSELFGIVGLLVSILLSEGRIQKSPNTQSVKLPQTVIALAVQAVRILNNVAQIDLATLQETLSSGRQQELYHLMVNIFDYCTSRLGSKSSTTPQAEETDLLHEMIALLGYHCLLNPENQKMLCYGEGQTLLAKLTALPLHYFMNEAGQATLFPTILATCFRSQQNLELLRCEMNLSLLKKYLTAQIASTTTDSAGTWPRFPRSLWTEAQSFFE